MRCAFCHHTEFCHNTSLCTGYSFDGLQTNYCNVALTAFTLTANASQNGKLWWQTVLLGASRAFCNFWPCSSFTVLRIWMFASWPLTLLNLWVLNLWFYITIHFNWNLWFTSTSARGHGIFSALEMIIFWQLFHNLGNSEGIATFLVKWCSGDSNLTI